MVIIRIYVTISVLFRKKKQLCARIKLLCAERLCIARLCGVLRRNTMAAPVSVVCTQRESSADGHAEIMANHSKRTQPLVRGQFLHTSCPGGLHIDSGITDELCDANVLHRAHQGIMLVIVLEGVLEFAYDDHTYRCNACHQPQALAVSVCRDSTFRRRLIAGNHLKKVNILLPPEWLDGYADEQALPLLSALHRHHLGCVRWQPSTAIFDPIQALLPRFSRQNEADPLTQHLHALTIIKHLCEQASHLTIESVTELIPATHEPQIAKAVAYIETKLHTALTLSTIAHACGLSRSTLQRRFRTHLGMPVSDYIRRRRLVVVKEKLLHEAISIGEAAYWAGYHHPSNFVTAFKRQFGMTPGQLIQSQTHTM
ncbi:AraC family transcriptional regulator [Salinivibrio sp. VYel9]|nr:AraC family transcriptional regulator [Salinivibrio sp. VYel7]MPX91936.1 AraC family transcriptional regulator [Salinivibrio sp. VYel1]MPX94855.1 AraC family transcriptional regulator [Salinivibrio sp. VYel9]MPX97937.1 AraC family transcriptional regulator [Salinivibrio sp. VYel6]MPY01216.1 AraC family transcriptional regulator [Salinivibrio sp. VYel4]MPY04185.1 AraC family transcriptional regulator [Salinivibrio sp. VYel5]MPY07163.1 AraC family transcriptional regulator [Salinivibrio sp. 